MIFSLPYSRTLPLFFLRKRRGIPLLIIFDKKKKQAEYSTTKQFMKQKRNKENGENYTRASSHSDTRALNLDFALRLTKANSLLKC